VYQEIPSVSRNRKSVEPSLAQLHELAVYTPHWAPQKERVYAMCRLFSLTVTASPLMMASLRTISSWQEPARTTPQVSSGWLPSLRRVELSAFAYSLDLNHP
jgi:hypothetical protein